MIVWNIGMGFTLCINIVIECVSPVSVCIETVLSVLWFSVNEPEPRNDDRRKPIIASFHFACHGFFLFIIMGWWLGRNLNFVCLLVVCISGWIQIYFLCCAQITFCYELGFSHQFGFFYLSLFFIFFFSF